MVRQGLNSDPGDLPRRVGLALPFGFRKQRQGKPYPTGKLAIFLALCFGFATAHAQTPSKPVPIDSKPYAIRVLIDFDPATRVDAARRASILDGWITLIRRFVGTPWVVEVAADPGWLSAIAVEGLKADDLKGSSNKADKVWAIRVESTGPALRVEGRELDVATGWLGEVQRREVAHPSDLPRELLRLSLAMFTATAEVGESKGGGVSFLVQGGSLQASSPLGEVAPVGTIFRALRIFPKTDGTPPEILEIRYSYFRVERLDGPVARCEIVGGVRDPLTNRYPRPNKVMALGIKPSSSPTRLRFLTKADRQPAAGYRLIARPIAAGSKPIELGMTDREGRITMRPGAVDGLANLRLMAGNEEPMFDIPVMPGESSEERTVVFEPKPLTLALEAKLDALRDAIVDVVVVRARLELRMKTQLDAEAWADLDDSIREFRKLTPRDDFVARLEAIREQGQRQEAEGKAIVLTRNARVQLDETKGLIERYLDDELIRSYEDAASRAKTELARPKPPAKKGN